jgi:hypothetical protein
MAHPVRRPRPAQPAQPSQPARQYLSSQADVCDARAWLEEEGDNFENHVQGLQNLARYREAEKRTRQKETPELAEDFPATAGEQNELARRLYDALKRWKPGMPGCTFSAQAVKKVTKQKKFSFELVAWSLLVRSQPPTTHYSKSGTS